MKVNSDNNNNIPDLTHYVPVQYRKYVLGVVKWYGDDIETNVNDIDNKNSNVLASLNSDVAANSSDATAKELRIRAVIGDAAYEERQKEKLAKENQSHRTTRKSSVGDYMSSQVTAALATLTSSRSPFDLLKKSTNAVNPVNLGQVDALPEENSLDAKLDLPIKKSLLSTLTITKKSDNKYKVLNNTNEQEKQIESSVSSSDVQYTQEENVVLTEASIFHFSTCHSLIICNYKCECKCRYEMECKS